MKSYYVIFELHQKNICGTWRRANSKEEAMTDATFSLACHYSNVEYDNCYIASVKN